MLQYKHILIATDLSQYTDKVADHAFALAKLAKANISLVHVVEHTPIVYGGGEFSIPLDINLEEALRENATQALRVLGKRLEIPEQNQFVETGSIKRSIVELAEKLGVDLIVLGAHGKHGIEKILGSSANAVMHAAKCDVLTVRVYE